jgi:hypothetical protein
MMLNLNILGLGDRSFVKFIKELTLISMLWDLLHIPDLILVFYALLMGVVSLITGTIMAVLLSKLYLLQQYID